MDTITERYQKVLAVDSTPSPLNEWGLYRRGKFAGQSPLARALYQLHMEGRHNDEAGSVTETGGHRVGFRLDDAEARRLEVKNFLVLVEDSEYAVTLEGYDTEAEYEAAMAPPHPPPDC